MGISKAADLYYTYRFIKTLITPWKDMEAFDLGIIDDTGKNLIKTRDLKTNEQKDAFTTFHRLVFNIKRIMEKVPFGKSRIASYAAALYLLREDTGMSEESIMKALEELGCDTSDLLIIEDAQGDLELKQYILSDTIDEDHPKGSIITLENIVDTFAGIPIYNTTEGIFVTSSNIS
jgi:hypothetical protein